MTVVPSPFGDSGVLWHRHPRPTSWAILSRRFAAPRSRSVKWALAGIQPGGRNVLPAHSVTETSRRSRAVPAKLWENAPKNLCCRRRILCLPVLLPFRIAGYPSPATSQPARAAHLSQPTAGRKRRDTKSRRFRLSCGKTHPKNLAAAGAVLGFGKRCAPAAAIDLDWPESQRLTTPASYARRGPRYALG